MHILIVKLTSMGDLIHALPAIQDAAQAIPDLHIDWIVDEAFAQIPELSLHVEHIITTAHRRWRKNKWEFIRSKEFLEVYRHIREKKYDIVIDAQNNLKSAVITALTRGKKMGMDKNSAREKLAHCFCNETFFIPLNQHAIMRQRMLFSKALGYTLPESDPQFGIDFSRLPHLPKPCDSPYLVFIHSTTWDNKHWPESYWEALIQKAAQAGYSIVLPWGNAKEQARAQRLAQASPSAIVLPRLSILEQASILKQSAGVVAVDTGLGHLSAALNIPGVHLYGPTDPALIGATGQNQTHLSARYHCAPCYLHTCQWSSESECFTQMLKPDSVWEALCARLGSKMCAHQP